MYCVCVLDKKYFVPPCSRYVCTIKYTVCTAKYTVCTAKYYVCVYQVVQNNKCTLL